MEPKEKPFVDIVAFLHGALQDKSSMKPIAREVLKAFPGSKAIFIEIPGHGVRAGQLPSSFTLDDLAADSLNELQREIGADVHWSRIGLVGESIGALVFARMIETLPESPAFALFGEPPLSNRPYLEHLEAEFLEVDDAIGPKLADELFRFNQPELTTWHRYFIKLSCPSLLVYGECRADNTPQINGWILSIIGPKDIEALRSATSLVTVGVQGCGHRLLNARPFYCASILRELLEGE